MDRQTTVLELARIIQLAAHLVAKLPDNLKDHYSGEVKELIQQYNKELALLKKEMEDYFESERLTGVTNLALRRAYEQLKFL